MSWVGSAPAPATYELHTLRLSASLWQVAVRWRWAVLLLSCLSWLLQHDCSFHLCITHPSPSTAIFMVVLHINFVIIFSFLSDLAVAADFSETLRFQYKRLCYWKPERAEGGEGKELGL